MSLMALKVTNEFMVKVIMNLNISNLLQIYTLNFHNSNLFLVINKFWLKVIDKPQHIKLTSNLNHSLSITLEFEYA